MERQRSKINETILLGSSSLEILYVLPTPLLVGQFSDFPQISLSTLSRPWSAKGAKLPKHFCLFFILLEIVYVLPNPLLVGQFSDFPQISQSTLSGPWSAKGAKMAKQNYWGFRRWKSCMFCEIHCWWASFQIFRRFL